MKRALSGVAIVLLTGALTITLNAQTTTPVHPGAGGSPHVRTDWTVGGAHISIEYGRPFLKGRAESEVMPPGQPWRTGADEATTLTTDQPLVFGRLTVPAGTYTLYAVPGESVWQLIVSKSTGQWGIPYPEGQDLGRVPMITAKLKTPVEQLTISIDPTLSRYSEENGGMLIIEWGATSASTIFEVGH